MGHITCDGIILMIGLELIFLVLISVLQEVIIGKSMLGDVRLVRRQLDLMASQGEIFLKLMVQQLLILIYTLQDFGYTLGKFN